MLHNAEIVLQSNTPPYIYMLSGYSGLAEQEASFHKLPP